MESEPRPPLPPFTSETAAEKVRKAEDAWQTVSNPSPIGEMRFSLSSVRNPIAPPSGEKNACRAPSVPGIATGGSKPASDRRYRHVWPSAA